MTICVCGHTKQEHKTWKGWSTQRCETCIFPYLNTYPKYQKETQEAWHDYKPDNLRFLEGLVYQKDSK